MDRSESHMNVKLGKTDSRSPSRAEPDVSYAELHFKTLSTPQVRTDRDGLTSTYSEMKFRKEEPRIDEDEHPPISSGPGGMTAIAQTAAQEQELKVKIKIRTYRLICLLSIVTSALILTVAGVWIHGMYSDLRHRFTEIETKYRSVNESKAQICALLTSRREQTCSLGWVTKNDRCYYVSTNEKSFHDAWQQCTDRESRLLEIKSADEASFVSHNFVQGSRAYWIGKCENGNVGWSLLFKVSSGKPLCRQCESNGRTYPCERDRRFICERSAPVFPDIPEKIQGLCQQPVEANLITNS